LSSERFIKEVNRQSNSSYEKGTPLMPQSSCYEGTVLTIKKELIYFSSI